MKFSIGTIQAAANSGPPPPTGVSFVAAGAITTHAGSGTQNVPVPAGLSSGDLMIGYMNSFSADTVPTGWTNMYNGTAAGSNLYRLCFRRFVPGDTNMVISHAGFSLGCSIVYGFSGVSTTLNDNGLPIDGTTGPGSGNAANYTYAASSSSDLTAGTIVTATVDAKVYALFTTFDDNCTAFSTATLGTELDEQYGTWGGFLLVEQSVHTPGSVTGPASHGSGSGGTLSQLAWSLAIRP